MAGYTVTCKECGAISTGNSKWIPTSAVKKAGRACQSCGSANTEITPGWPIGYKSSSNKSQPSTKNPVEKAAEEYQNLLDEGRRRKEAKYRSILYNIKMIIFAMVLPVCLLVFLGQACERFVPSSSDSGEYCAPGLYGAEC